MKLLQPFDSALKHTQLAAATRALLANTAHADFAYLKEAAASNLLDRLNDITTPFQDVVDLGAHHGVFAQTLAASPDSNLARSKLNSFTQLCQTPAQSSLAASVRLPRIPHQSVRVVEDFAELPLAPASCDLVVSSLALHWANNLPATLQAVERVLKPEGCFVGIMFGGDTLHELNVAMSLAEQEREGGLGSHVSPMLRVADACGLLSGAGFKLVTVDAQEIQVEYDHAFALMRHLWYQGEANATKTRRPFVPRQTLLASAAAMHYLFAQPSGLPVTFELVCMIGWKEGAGLAKPLAPGSKDHVSLGVLGKGFEG